MHDWKKFYGIWSCEKCHALSNGIRLTTNESLIPACSAIIIVTFQNNAIYNAWERTDASHEPDDNHKLVSCEELQVLSVLKE